MSSSQWSVSVDLDAVHHYHRLHGLGEPRRAPQGLLHALGRFEDLFDELGIRATFFVVGEDLGDEALAAGLRRLVARGHELANHSATHPYGFPQLSSAEQRREIEQGHQAILAHSGVAPVGFRAPGYALTATVVQVLEELGYRYDSSLLPSPPYGLAKAAAVLGGRLRGRRSAAGRVDPRGLWAPSQPYRPDPRLPWRRGDAALIELPIGTTPGLRLPIVGTSIILAGPALRGMLLAGARARGGLCVELHALDLLVPERDGLEPRLVALRPDLRLPLGLRRRRLAEFFRALGGSASTMASLAGRY